jgi:tryptophan 7-halogenase
MNAQKVKKVVIAGGGTAGWCSAAALSKFLGPLIDITLVESEDVGIIGVGEATIPTVRSFHQFLELDEDEFLRATNATFKLGIAFENWAHDGDRYIHSFGEIGESNWVAPFHNLWLQARAEGYGGELGDYCLELKAAEAGKFARGGKSRLNYAYHFDAVLYGQFLRRFSEKNGVKRIEGRIRSVDQDSESGDIKSLTLESGAVIEGDLFIDCTGFHGLLIEKALQTGYDDWSHWLPTDRACAVQTQSAGTIMPYTRAIAHEAGWRWRIPLQNRVGNGLVYSSAHMTDDKARERLLETLDAPTLNEPRLIRYQTGRRKKMWHKNCVAIGLSSGFIEPLESTSIHLFQMAATRLIQNFPFEGINEGLINRYNALTIHETERVRDFVILHYRLNQRDESFWRERAEMSIPDTLRERIDLFSENAIAYQGGGDLFRVDSWVQVMMGQGVEPKSWHQMARAFPRDMLQRGFGSMKADIAAKLATMPSHQQVLQRLAPEAA